MDFIALALYSEGFMDDRFLSLVIERTAQRILHTSQQNKWQILPVKPIHVRKQKDRAKCILEAAHEAVDQQILIVHSDEDGNGLHVTRQNRFQSGYNLVQQSSRVCKSLMPMIPVQEAEAWMLADYRLLLEEIGTKKKAWELNILEKAHLVETIARPKERPEAAIRLAFKDRPGRLKKMSVREIRASLYEPMGRNVDLDRLDLLNGYTCFKSELIAVFQALNILP